MALTAPDKDKDLSQRQLNSAYSSDDYYYPDDYQPEFIVMTHELPPQLQLGGTEETIQEALTLASSGS